MESGRRKIILIVLVIVLIAAGVYLIVSKSNKNNGEEEYKALEKRLCGITLDLSVSNPETIIIDKTTPGSVEYVTLTTLSGLTMDKKDKVSRYIINPKESNKDKTVYFKETTRIKLKVDKNKKVVCDGIVDIGTAPSLTLKGEEKMIISIGSTYKDPGYTAIDKEDGNLTDKVLKNGMVNASLAGDYTILYFVEDSMGNITSKTRIVTVK